MIDIVDISALPKWNWQQRLEAADVLFFSGGTTPHLMRWIEEFGLKELLPKLLETRLYVGVSAGSIVVSPTLSLINQTKAKWYKEKFGYETNKGLGYINFHLRPHLNDSSKPENQKESLAERANKISGVVYGIDDQMAIRVVDGKAEVIGEGEYVVFNSDKV